MPIEKHMEKLSPQVRIFALVAVLAAVGGLLFVFIVRARRRRRTGARCTAAGRGGREEGEGSGRAQDRSRRSRSAKAPAKAKAPAEGRRAEESRSQDSADRLPPRGRQSACPAQGRRRLPRRSGLTRRRACGRRGEGRSEARRCRLSRAERPERAASPTRFWPSSTGLKQPSLLVLKRSGEVVLALEGFVDRETVAQAAANAAP